MNLGILKISFSAGQGCRLPTAVGCNPVSEEVLEAAKWLKATGFPQYVQLFKNGAFPIDLDLAKGKVLK